MMDRIYTSAKLTACWLGPQAHDSELAIQLLRHLAEKSLQFEQSGASNEESQQWMLQIVVGNKWQRHWAAFEPFFLRPWWNRAWVVQECLLSKAFYFTCGETPMTFDDIPSVSDLYLTYRDVLGWELMFQNPDHGVRAINAALPYYVLDCHFYNKKLGFLQTVAYTWGNRTTDPRDHLYSIRGLPLEGADILPTVDYSASVANVYIDTVLDFIRVVNSLDIICLSHIQKGRTDLPSWVPDFSAPDHGTDLMVLKGQQFSEKDYSASGTSLPCVHSTLNRNQLVVSGFTLGVISGLAWTYIFTSDHHCGRAFKYMLPLEQAAPSKSASTTELEAREAILRALLLDRGVCDTLEHIAEGFVQANRGQGRDAELPGRYWSLI